MYVIAASETGPVKLGISADPEQRLKALQTGHPQKLSIWHCEPVQADRIKLYERLLHRDNNHHRLRSEWFNMTTSDAAAYCVFTTIHYGLCSIEELEREFRRR